MDRSMDRREAAHLRRSIPIPKYSVKEVKRWSKERFITEMRFTKDALRSTDVSLKNKETAGKNYAAMKETLLGLLDD